MFDMNVGVSPPPYGSRSQDCFAEQCRNVFFVAAVIRDFCGYLFCIREKFIVG
jgi:hypothetical protein